MTFICGGWALLGAGNYATQSENVFLFQSRVSSDAKAADNVMSVSSTLGNSLGKVSLLFRMEEEEERFFLHRLLLLSISPVLAVFGR